MVVLNDDVVKYERPAARASEDGLERPRVAIYLDMRSNITAADDCVRSAYISGGGGAVHTTGTLASSPPIGGSAWTT